MGKHGKNFKSVLRALSRHYTIIKYTINI